jgi:hypothetical protein
MLTQKQFVRDCYNLYKEQRLDPGNPFHGDWQKAHYPKPKSSGSIRWVWLLKEHHAIQSVLQSEECGHPAVWSWERKYFVGEWDYLLPLYEKWLSEKGRRAGKASVAGLSPEQIKQRCLRAGNAPRVNPLKPGHRVGSAPATEKQKAVAKESALRLHEQKNEEGKSLHAVAVSKKGLNARWRCLVTGMVSNAGNIVRMQKRRGIDPSPSNRIKLTDHTEKS